MKKAKIVMESQGILEKNRTVKEVSGNFNRLSTRKSFTIPPGDFRSWESPQTLPVLLIAPFEHVKRF